MSFSDHDSPCNPIFKDYKILNFKKHLNLNQARFMWQIANNE